jgi:hypothetical protein
MPVDTRHHRPDWRQLDVVIGLKCRLIGGRKRMGAVRTGRGEGLGHFVRALAQRPKSPGMALLPGRPPLGPVGLLSLARRQRGIGRCLRRLAELGFKFLNPLCQGGNPRRQRLDLRRLLRNHLGLRQEQRDQIIPRKRQ